MAILVRFVRAFDIGGTFWEGEDEYDSMEDALLGLEVGVQICMREIHGE